MTYLTDRDRCDAIFSAARLEGHVAALGLWKLISIDTGLDPVVLEIAARGDPVHEEAVRYIRDYEGTERMMRKHGVVLNNPAELEELLRRLKPGAGKTYVHGIPVAPPDWADKEDDRATAMLHAYMDLGSRQK